MARINVQNTTGMPIYVGSVMIPAGDSRDIDERDVPEHLKPPRAVAPEAPPADTNPPPPTLEDLRAQKVDTIKEALVGLSDDDLIALEAAETADPTPRKTLLEAITAERLRRAGAAK